MIVLIIGVLGASRKRIALTDFLLVSSFLYMSFYAARNVAIFALVTPAMITRHATVIINKSRRLIKVSPTPSAVSGRRQQVLNSAIVIILIILILFRIIPGLFFALLESPLVLAFYLPDLGGILASYLVFYTKFKHR